MNNATAGRGGVVNGTVARAVKCTAALRAIDRVELERGKRKVTDLLLTDNSMKYITTTATEGDHCHRVYQTSLWGSISLLTNQKISRDWTEH